MSFGTNTPLTVTMNILPRLNNWRADEKRQKSQFLCIVFAICAVYLIPISAVGGGGREEEGNKK